MTRALRFIAVTCLFVTAPAVFAQQPPAQAPPQPVEATPAPAFTYDPGGRRDPFISLLGRGVDGRSATSRPLGLPGVLIDEVMVKGIVRDARGLYALVQGPDRKIHTLRAGDRLMDGTVKTVTPGEVVFSQDVNDPLLLQKQREIRKSLRPGEESHG
ncbi:hypothetical protein BH23ACI1_BH23ACI1_32690 [soil metagenome]